ncbi:uncharacterized protein LOC126582437 [Malus sylvestris]|uniref:uncharacterized protein LOC126582436 n=1 Tax=Malus sylvestris TaxID=3752 RepID=UPI0021AC36BA|nr:uncharacterized protein LOC126582436 [Malus sylvestris]XP_050102545.1 uncharacterized protein LOC126582437 [Malus sylvestris]
MSLPLGSLSSLTSLPLLCTVHTRTHPSPRARKPITLHHLVLLSLPLVSVNSAKNPERNSGGFLYFPVRLWDEIEAGCKHTQLRQPRGFFPAISGHSTTKGRGNICDVSMIASLRGSSAAKYLT